MASYPVASPTAAPEQALAFFADYQPPAGDFLADALAGLTAAPKRLPPKYFYDRTGSRLFDAICRTPEYYVTRTELGLLSEIGAELGARAGAGSTVIEFGSGSSIKIRRLLDALDTPASYVAIDISRDHLLAAAAALAAAYSDVKVGAVCADFTKPLDLPAEIGADRGLRLGFLPGSTIGNFAPNEAARFLTGTARILGPGGALLIGVDLKKDPALLDAAYNDAEGYTAAFNLNLLRRMKSELDAGIDEDGFEHLAFYNEALGRVEMHLRSRHDQTMSLAGQDLPVAGGETIHTESSYKYTIAEFQEVARSAGFAPAAVWTDDNHLFSIHWLAIP